MKFTTALVAATAPAFILVACEKAAVNDTAAAEEATDEASAGEPAEGEATDAETAAEAPPSSGSAPDLAGNWTCEDQGDVEVTIARKADGSASITFDNKSEMAMGEPPIVTPLKASGGSARMTDEQGMIVVNFLADGRAEVTDGEGEYRTSYMCAKAS